MKKIKTILKSQKNVVKSLANLSDNLRRKVELYSVGGVLFDLHNPEKILAK